MGLSLKKLGASITDIFDANSKKDQEKRLSQGQPQYYQQQKPQGNMVQAGYKQNLNAVKSLVDPLYAGGAAISDAAKFGTAKITNNPVAAANAKFNLGVRGGQFATPFANTARIPYEFGKQGAAALTGNTQAYNRAQDRIDEIAPDSYLVAPFAKMGSNLGTSLAADRVLKDAREGKITYKQAEAILNSQYAKSGFDLKDSTATAIRKTAGLGAEGALNIASLNPIQSAAGKLGTFSQRVAPAVTTNVKLGIATTAAQIAQQNNISIEEANKLLAQNVGTSAALPAVAGLAGQLARGTPKVAMKTAKALENPAISELKVTRQRLQTQWDKASPQSRRQIAQAIKGVDNEMRTIQQGGYIKGAEKPKVSLKSNVVKQAEAPNDQGYRAAQAAREQQYTQPALVRAKDAIQRELVDPRTVQQRLDNAEFKRLKKAGEIKRGQKELTPEQSLANLRGRIENPQRAAEVRNKQKYATPSGEQLSINDIIKKYGKESSQKARDFEQYRIYKDELDRLNKGADNTLGLDPRVMDGYVRGYEARNPQALEHNAVLRQASLDALEARRTARIDNPELYDKLSQYEFYNPRKALDPEDLIRPGMTGGVRSGAKGTMARSETAGGTVRSPLSIFRDTNTQLERAVAEQQYGLVLRDRTRAGSIKGASEVINAEDVIVRKQLLEMAKEAAAPIEKNVTALRRASANRRVAGIKAKQAEFNAIKAARNELRKAIDAEKSSVRAKVRSKDKAVVRAKGQARLVESRETPKINAAMERVRKQLLKDTDDPDAQAAIRVMSKDDLMQTIDGQYASFNSSTRVASAEARVEQLQATKQRLTEAIPDVEARQAIGMLDDDELMSVFRAIADDKEGGYYTTLKNSLEKKSAAHRALVDEVDGLRAQIKADRQNAASLRSGASEFTQNLERGTQTYSYKLDGETGKIEIPNDLAKELAKANELQNKTFIEKGLTPIATAQKLTWTGALQPAFKVWNVLVKNPVLMFRNADGLSGIRPEATLSIIRQIANTKKMKAFTDAMKSRGAPYENALQTRNIVGSTADDIAARSGVISFFNRNPVNTLGDMWKGLNRALSAPDNAQRTAVAYGAYKRARGLGFDEKQALDIASQAPAKVFGDFDRVSRLAQNAEVIIPYTGAIQAGVRSLARATKTKPIQTTLKDAALLTSMGGITAWSLGNNSEYYEDMIAQDKEYFLDNNWTFVLPGASKDADGNWSGVVHIPLTPDLRPLNRAAWRSVHKITNEEASDPKMMAGELFNMFTGDTARNIYDSQKADKSNNKLNAVLSGSPVLNLGKTLAGVNTYTGEPLASGYTASRPRTEQVSGNTSETAKNASKITQGVLTPQQFDQIFNQIGSTGDILQGKEKPGLDPILKPLKPGISQTESKKSGANFYKDLEVVAKTAPNEKTFNAFNTLHTKDEDKTIDDPAAKAKMLLADKDLLNMEAELDKRARQRGEPGNPFYDLDSNQQEKVLRYRGSKDLNAAKQAYDKDGNPLFMALGLDEQWYSDLKDKEEVFYDTINEKRATNLEREIASATDPKEKEKLVKELADVHSGNDGDRAVSTYSGAKKPELTPEQESAVDYYYTLPKGTGERSAFLKQNPWLLEHWAAGEQFTNAERLAMGMKVSEEDTFGSSGSGYSSSKKDSTYGSLDPYKYAISLKSGGGIAKPKVSVKKAGSAPSRKASKRQAPKVTLKRSMV